jgi:DNA invertase Pin-like site-specific DNA recombinase
MRPTAPAARRGTGLGEFHCETTRAAVLIADRGVAILLGYITSVGPTFISYLRVSTDKQGRSGLGLEAQRHAVTTHVAGGRLLAEYIEIESGKRNDRPQLAVALAHARATGARLIIAKLDRLSRSVYFISSLMEAGVDFLACDLPMADKLTIHVLAAVAEHEREMISARTKAAMAAAKARGVRFGNPHGARALRAAGKGNAAANVAQRANVAAWRAGILPIVTAIRATGVTSARRIAIELDRRGILTPRGGRWRGSMVLALLNAGT